MLVQKVDRQPREEVARQPREEVAQQPRGEVSRQAKFFQPTQPIPKPNCDRSGQLDNTQDVLLIKAKHPGLERSRRNLLTKNSVLQIDQGNLITTHEVLLIKAKHPGLERSRRNLLTKNSVLQIDQGNLINITSHFKKPLKYIVRLRRSTSTMS